MTAGHREYCVIGMPPIKSHRDVWLPGADFNQIVYDFVKFEKMFSTFRWPPLSHGLGGCTGTLSLSGTNISSHRDRTSKSRYAYFSPDGTYINLTSQLRYQRRRYSSFENPQKNNNYLIICTKANLLK